MKIQKFFLFVICFNNLVSQETQETQKKQEIKYLLRIYNDDSVSFYELNKEGLSEIESMTLKIYEEFENIKKEEFVQLAKEKMKEDKIVLESILQNGFKRTFQEYYLDDLVKYKKFKSLFINDYFKRNQT